MCPKKTISFTLFISFYATLTLHDRAINIASLVQSGSWVPADWPSRVLHSCTVSLDD